MVSSDLLVRCFLVARTTSRPEQLSLVPPQAAFGERPLQRPPSGDGCRRGLALARGLPLRVCFRRDDLAPPHVHFTRAKPERFQLVVHARADAVGGAELRDRVGVALAAWRQRMSLARGLALALLLGFDGGGFFHLAASDLRARHR